MPSSSAPVTSSPDMVKNTASFMPSAPATSNDFDAFTIDDNPRLTIPADPHGAAGPNHVGNVGNISVEFYEKNGTQVLSDSLANFFSSLNPDTFTFDPKILFDQKAGRFVVITLEQEDDGSGGSAETSEIFVAVSDDADPSGTWYMTAIDAKPTIDGTEAWADYPGFATDEEAVYITTNMFAFSADGGSFEGVRLWVIDKGLDDGGLYDGGTAQIAQYDPYAGGGQEVTTQPAQIFGVPGADVGTFLVSYSGLRDSGTGESFLQVVRIDNPVTSPTFTQQFINVGVLEDFGSFPDAPQADTSDRVATNDRRALDAVWHDDSLWLTATIHPESGDPDTGEATAHWWHLDTSSLSSIAVNDQGNIGGEDIASDTHTFFPAVAINGLNQAVFGFSASASTIYPGSFYTTRTPSDPAGSTSGSATLRSGIASYVRTFCGSNRWGDYSGAATDPADGSFWVYNKHAISQGSQTSQDCDGDGTTDITEDGRWGTAHGTLTVSGACAADMFLAEQTISSTIDKEAASVVRAGNNIAIDAGANVRFQAGSRIAMNEGFSVADSATFTAQIQADPCN